MTFEVNFWFPKATSYETFTQASSIPGENPGVVSQSVTLRFDDEHIGLFIEEPGVQV